MNALMGNCSYFRAYILFWQDGKLLSRVVLEVKPWRTQEHLTATLAPHVLCTAKHAGERAQSAKPKDVLLGVLGVSNIFLSILSEELIAVLLAFDVGEFFGDETCLHLEDIDTAYVPFLPCSIDPAVFPAHNAALSKAKDLLDIDMSLWRL